NAGIAAGALGYNVTMIEQDKSRCELINGRYGAEVEKWQMSSRLNQASLFGGYEGSQLGLLPEMSR
ncbi:MAG: hypothetical protein KC419_14410, partial [Anaerolineales bacterium]|nr:hypothetical protein [Anaerolineales bacterium]